MHRQMHDYSQSTRSNHTTHQSGNHLPSENPTSLKKSVATDVGFHIWLFGNLLLCSRSRIRAIGIFISLLSYLVFLSSFYCLLSLAYCISNKSLLHIKTRRISSLSSINSLSSSAVQSLVRLQTESNISSLNKHFLLLYKWILSWTSPPSSTTPLSMKPRSNVMRIPQPLRMEVTVLLHREPLRSSPKH